MPTEKQILEAAQAHGVAKAAPAAKMAAPYSHAKPLRLTRSGGRYTYKIRNTVFEVHQNDDPQTTWYKEWIITEPRTGDYGDPIRTLGDVRAALRYMEEHPDQYGIR